MPAPRRMRGEDGVTLVELLTAMTLLAVVTAFAMGAVVSAFGASRRQTAQLAALNDAKVAFERVTRDIRAADPVHVAALDRIRLDVRPTDATASTVTYERVGNSLVATDAATANTRTLVDDLVAGQPLFLYHLTDGSAVTGQVAIDPRTVLAVTVRLRTEPKDAGRVVDLQNRVAVRNVGL